MYVQSKQRFSLQRHCDLILIPTRQGIIDGLHNDSDTKRFHGYFCTFFYLRNFICNMLNELGRIVFFFFSFSFQLSHV